MRRFVTMALVGVLHGLRLNAQDGQASKENLDLPYDASLASERAESAPEVIVFYGEQYEGHGVFFCCGTTVLCAT